MTQKLKVIKRDGRKVAFQKEKIVNAVMAAFKEVGDDSEEYARAKAENIASYVENKLSEENRAFNIEDIQDMIEKGLMSCKSKNVAKAYILYREERSRARNYNTKIMQSMKSKLFAENVENANANLDEMSFGGRKGEAANSIMKQYALDYCMSEMSRNNHLNNEIYIHDLDSYALGMHNCLTIPFDDLLANGFNTRQVDIRPANSINTAFQLLAVIFQIQSLQQFGGVSASHLDWTMMPYVRKSFAKHFVDGMYYCELETLKGNELLDKGKNYISALSITNEELKYFEKAYQYAMDMTKRELKQAVEGMFHNLNSLQSRSGNQLPFSSINLGSCTTPEGRMVIKAVLEGAIKGVGKHHRTSIFPCVIFQTGKGINLYPEDPNYDLFKLALKSTAKRLYPNYANLDWTGNAGYDKNDPRTYFSTMGCRTANGWDINGFGQLKDGRGNICPVTIIMPTLAMQAKEYAKNGCNENVEDLFMKILDKKIHEAKDMLIERFDYICSQDPDSAKFMYENGTMAGYVPEEGIRSALKHGTLAIGQIALAETLQILIGKNHTTPEGLKLAHKIEKLFKDRCAEFKEEYKLNFGVYYTPAEGLCSTALEKFKAQYGVIPYVSDKDFFTNSVHIPVWEEVTPFEKADIESQLAPYSSAGNIFYVELDGGMDKNIDALEDLIRYTMEKDLPYVAINVPNDTCLDCGFTGEFDDKCPECNSTNIQQLRRVTGYLTGNYKTAFNKGKVDEVARRIRHSEVREV